LLSIRYLCNKERLIYLIDCDLLEEALKKGSLDKGYLFCGLDEKLIKDSIGLIVNSAIDKTFADLNYIRFDGSKADINDIINACETMPFMSERKVVLVYRATFLGEKEDRESKKKFDEINKYVDNLPRHCVLIMYYVFEDDREKPSSSVKKLEKRCTVVKVDKLKGDKYYKKVKNIFSDMNKDIGKVELRFFCDNVDNNMDIVIREVDKLVNFCEGREITRADIIKLLPQKNDDDIFDLVDFLSQKRPEKAIDILNELIYRGENILGILFMIQRQFKILLNVKLALESGKGKEDIAKSLRLHPFIAEKMIVQSKKFTLTQLKRCLEMCLNTERIFKSSAAEKNIEMELLIVNTVRV
jgi:DNA polymerase-3 subunit delta